MCMTDFINAQCKNRRIDAKIDAELDAIYERERQRQGLPSEFDYKHDDERISNLEHRVSMIEKRLDKLDDLYHELKKTTSDGMYKVSNAPTGLVSLTPDQFKEFMNAMTK